MSDITVTALELINARHALHPLGGNPVSKNLLVSVKMHRLREELDAKLSATLKSYDEAEQRFAKQQDGVPVALQGVVFTPFLTPAYERDPEQHADLSAALVPILSERITIHAAKLTEQDAGWITSERDIGAALALFME